MTRGVALFDGFDQFLLGPFNTARNLLAGEYVVAGLINGFIVPATAAAFAGADQATTSALNPVLRLCREANTVCAKADVVWASGAILLWSIALLRHRGFALAAGIVGLICGIIPLALLATGHLPMNVRGFGTFVLLQGVFAAAAAAGVMMVRKT